MVYCKNQVLLTIYNKQHEMSSYIVKKWKKYEKKI